MAMDTIHTINDKQASDAVQLVTDMQTITAHDMDLIDSMLLTGNDLESMIDLFCIGYKTGFIRS